MRLLRQQQRGFFHGVTRLALVLLFASGVSLGDDKNSIQKDLPVVTQAVVPFYPPTARLAHIEGVVRLQVSTNGETVSRVEVLEGQVVLAGAARDNVKTWHLKLHAPTTFETIFRYRLLPESICEPDNSTVLLRLPLEVEVSTRGLKTCDPTTEVKSK